MPALNTRAVVLLLAALIAGRVQAVVAANQEPQQAQRDSTLEEVLVTGEHPGPGLWKVSHGDHTLWILGTHAPLPQRLIWRSQEVEWVMTESQEVMGAYSVSFTLQGEDALQSRGAALRTVLPRKAYSQWLKLKRKYIGRNPEVENLLPVSAALLLRSMAFEKAGLTNTDQVWREIHSLADRYNVPVTTRHQINRVVRNNAREDDSRAERVGVDYLLSTIQDLEADLRAARTRANAWATGDIDALRKQAEADKISAYLYASSWPFLQDGELQALLSEADRRWVDAGASALIRNRTTFAALPIFLLLRSDGVLSALRTRGFVVEEPIY
ncbi:MAG: TraB/GumN family protein [Steroidobacter sp.]